MYWSGNPEEPISRYRTRPFQLFQSIGVAGELYFIVLHFQGCPTNFVLLEFHEILKCKLGDIMLAHIKARMFFARTLQDFNHSLCVNRFKFT